MINKFIKKLNKKLKEKKGASMAIVIIAMSLLIVLGTTFSTLAYNSYKHSYGAICRQQAMFTAKSVLDGFIDEFKVNTTLRQKVGTKLLNEVQSNPDVAVNEVNAEINIAGLHDYMADGIIKDGKNVSDCKMYVSYSDNTRSRLKLIVSAKYKGFQNSLGAILGYTNKASMELSKIMSNTLFFTSPIVDFMYYVDDRNVKPYKEFAIDGDVYVDKPLWIDKNTPSPYENINTMPNIDGATDEATGGHTLEIDNQGRPNTLFDENGLPKPKDSNNIVYIKDSDGRYLPLLNANGEIVYSDTKVDVYKLQNNYREFIYVDKNGKETKNKHKADYELIDGKPFPEAFVKKDNLGAILNYQKLQDGQIYLQKDNSSNDMGCIQYDVSSSPGQQYGNYTDRLGNKILMTSSKNVVVDCEYDTNSGGYKKFPVEQIWYNGNQEFSIRTFGSKKDKQYTTGTIEVFKTIDPITREEILVTGKYNNNGKDGWAYDSRFSFKRVKIGGEDNRYVLLAKHDADGRFTGEYYEWKNFGKFHLFEFGDWICSQWIDRDVEPQPFYNIYSYQRQRATTQVQLPRKAYEVAVGPNEWTEVYLRSHYWSGIDIDLFNKHPVPIVIDGNLKCNTDVLLGLKNRGFDEETGKGGTSHGFKDSNGNIVPVSFDTKNDAYTIPKYNVLNLTGDIFVNGNVKGENLIVGGKLYAKDNNPEDDNVPGGCKGNVYLEQSKYNKPILGLKVSLGAYMELNDIVADGYVFIGGAAAHLSDRAHVKGNIYAGKYNEDGSRWGMPGTVISDIPAPKFYFEDPSKASVAKDIIRDNPIIPGAIYGYRTQTEINQGRRSRYELGSGDVVLQQTDVDGSIFATGDVYLSNGVCVKGNIYTPGNVYITKGNEKISITSNITAKDDARCRVWGNIYAGGDVAITGGCEVGRFEANKGEVGYFSSIYCGGNLLIRGRITGKNHDAVSGSVYAGGSLTIVGYESNKIDSNFTRVGYNGGNIYVKGDIIADKELSDSSPYISLSNGRGNIYCGGDLKLGAYCALDNHAITYVEGDCKVNSSWIHSGKLFVGGDLKLEGDTWYYKHTDVYNTTQYYVIGDVKGSGSAEGKESGNFKLYCNGSNKKLPGFAGKCPNTTNIDGKIKFVDSVKPADWNTVNKAEDFINIPKQRVAESTLPLQDKLELYKKSVSAQVKKWSSPEYSSNIYNDEYKGQGISASGQNTSIFVDKDNPNHYIIDDNVYAMPELELKPNSVLTIDTTKKNVHIVLNGNLVVGDGARVEIKGPNMAFIYVEPPTMNDNFNSPNLIQIGNNAVFGRIVGLDANQTEQNSGLHIISIIKDIIINVGTGAQILSYNYLPRGVLYLNLTKTGSSKGDALISSLTGSYTISRFKGKTLDTMYYWRVKFTNKKSPLILDINGDLEYGNNDSEITDFKGVEWVVVEYQ